MKLLSLLMAFLCCLLLGLILLRHCWKTLQVKSAIRRALEVRSINVLKIMRAGVWRDCGSFQDAFFAGRTIRDYHVNCQALDGTSYWMHLEAHFHPVWATLREIKILEADDAIKD